MIHGGNPFADDPSIRDPVRRFRGRLAAPVTVVTSGRDDDRAGLTVSSLFVVEGEPGQLRLVVAPTTDLWHVAAEFGRLIVHICTSEHRAMADVFAGLRPSPGGVFGGVEFIQTEWGPAIGRLRNRARCRVVAQEESGYSGIIVVEVDEVDVDDMVDPLVYFRGRYRSIG